MDSIPFKARITFFSVKLCQTFISEFHCKNSYLATTDTSPISHKRSDKFLSEINSDRGYNAILNRNESRETATAFCNSVILEP